MHDIINITLRNRFKNIEIGLASLLQDSNNRLSDTVKLVSGSFDTNQTQHSKIWIAIIPNKTNNCDCGLINGGLATDFFAYRNIRYIRLVFKNNGA